MSVSRDSQKLFGFVPTNRPTDHWNTRLHKTYLLGDNFLSCQ